MKQPCHRENPSGKSPLDALVLDYVAKHRKSVSAYLDSYTKLTLPEAVRFAALSVDPETRRRLMHQRRLPGAVLESAARTLGAGVEDIKGCKSFDELHSLVEESLQGIRGIGALTVYDIALRISAKLGILPERVYLHAGTAKGARALGVQGEVADRKSFPSALSKFQPYEIEDFLCIYKTRLTGRSRRSPQRGNNRC